MVKLKIREIRISETIGFNAKKRVECLMKLVLLFFCGLLIILLLLLLLIISSTIKLNIKKCYISNIEGRLKKKGLDKEILIYVEVYLLGIIKIAKIRITKKLLQKLKMTNDIKKIENDVKVIKKAHPIEIIKKLKIKIEKASLDLEFGTDSIMLTVYLVAILSSIVRGSFWHNRS